MLFANSADTSLSTTHQLPEPVFQRKAHAHILCKRSTFHGFHTVALAKLQLNKKHLAKCSLFAQLFTIICRK